MKWIVFDVDGVLIDTSESYDLASKLTVEYFLKTRRNKNIDIKTSHVKRLRSKGVFGDDYKLSEALIYGALGPGIEKFLNYYSENKSIHWIRSKYKFNINPKEIREVFDSFYFGRKLTKNLEVTKPLWKKEKPIINKKLITKLETKYKIGVITGRNNQELKLAEDIIKYKFENKITRNYYLKPNPLALYKLVRNDDGIYIGDSKCDEVLVENYNRKYGGFRFVMIGRDVKDVNLYINKILNSGLY